MGEPAIWIAAVAALISLLTGLFAFMRQPAFVSSHSVDYLRNKINELERRIVELEKANAALELLNTTVIAEREWWREEFRKERMRGE